MGGLALALAAGCGSSVDSGNGGGGSGGGVNVCAGFADEQGTASVTVRFQNNTTQPIYLPSECTVMKYDITALDGDDGLAYGYQGGCGPHTCERYQQGPPPVCGACPERVFRLDPGKTLETTWDGTGLKDGFTMPASCWDSSTPGGGPGGTCSKILAAAAGMYRIDATGWSDCTGTCTCDVDGVCEGSPSGVQAYPNMAKLTFPTDTSIDVIFDTCAFGCP